jgi:hypothetical protein
MAEIEWYWQPPSICIDVRYADASGWNTLGVFVRSAPQGSVLMEDGSTEYGLMPEKMYWAAEIARLKDLHPELKETSTWIIGLERLNHIPRPA